MHHQIPSTQETGILGDLNDLRVFAFVASYGSFSLAAAALRLHKSSVSRSVARLEGMLDAQLLERTTRKVVLTQRGAALNAECVEILARVDEAIAGERRAAIASRHARPALKATGAAVKGPGLLAWALAA